MIITLVGSRETPANILQELKPLCKYLMDNGHTGRSGHADGFDLMAENEMGEALTAYYPWASFNANQPAKGIKIVVSGTDATPEGRAVNELVYQHHPIFKDFPPRGTKTKPANSPWYYPMTRGAFALHRRNGCQVLGVNLNEPSNAVVCWAPGGKGGTGQAIRIAEHYKIPVLNMSLPEFETADLVIAALERLNESSEKNIPSG